MAHVIDAVVTRVQNTYRAADGVTVKEVPHEKAAGFGESTQCEPLVALVWGPRVNTGSVQLRWPTQPWPWLHADTGMAACVSAGSRLQHAGQHGPMRLVEATKNWIGLRLCAARSTSRHCSRGRWVDGRQLLRLPLSLMRRWLSMKLW